MTNDQIIEIAKQSGFETTGDDFGNPVVTVSYAHADITPKLTKFSELIQARAVPEPTWKNYSHIIERVEQEIDVGHTFWLEGGNVTPEEFVHAVLVAAAQKGSV